MNRSAGIRSVHPATGNWEGGRWMTSGGFAGSLGEALGAGTWLASEAVGAGPAQEVTSRTSRTPAATAEPPRNVIMLQDRDKTVLRWTLFGNGRRHVPRG